ncbi:MAG: AMP-binding protein [Microbacter sp.]
MIQGDQLWFKQQKHHAAKETKPHFETNRAHQILLMEGIPFTKELALQWAAQRLSNDSISDSERTFLSFLQNWWDDSPTLTVQTSGSTGTPKLLTVEKERMMQSAMMTCRYLQLHPGNKALLCLPVDYIAGKMMVVRALVAGLDLYRVDPSTHPLQQIPEIKFDFAAMIPLQVFHSLHDPTEKERLAAIHHCIIGGAPLDATLERELAPMPNSFYLTYGMTETLSHIAMRHLNGKKASPFYEPFPKVHLSLSDEGTLIIQAPLVADQEVRTNDTARLLEDGRFEILGRKDNIINSGGLKFQPEQLEHKLRETLSFPFVITSVYDVVLGEKMVLLIEQPTSQQEALDVQALQQKIRASLSGYEQPKAFYFCSQLPLTPNGKIDRIAAKKLIKQLKPVAF